MPKIEVSDADFARMQDLAEPLVDTPTSVVTKLLNAYDDCNANRAVSPIQKNNRVKVYSFDAPPPLVHVKFVSGIIGVHAPKKANWDAMVSLCLELVLIRIGDVEHAAKVIDLNVTRGKKVDEGYKYLPDINVSYQGVSAQHAATVIGKAARYLHEGAYVDFVWREKEEAFAPGQPGALSFDLS